MNKFTKILSVMLVLVLALSVMVLPTSAATPAVKADVVAEYQGTNTNGLDVYKFSVYLESTLSLCAYQLNITYDNAVWQVLRATNTNTNQAAIIANMVIDKNDTNNIMYQASDAYNEFGGGNWDYGTANGYVLMPGDGTNPTLAKISNTNMGTELTAAGYTGLYSTWANDFTDNYLCISGGSLNGHNSPTSGRVMVMSWYMGVKAGTQPGDYEVGFNAKQAYRLTGTYNTEDACGSLDVGVNKASITDDMVTYTNAIVTVGGAKELEISHYKNQIRFDTDKNGAYANQFDYRIVGQFDNFEDIFANIDDAKAKITDVGYVFTNSEVMDVEAAKAQVEGGEVVYSQVKDCYVSTTFEGTDYAFACFVSNIADTDANKAATLYGLGYVIYENADGETAYAYYDATLDVGALYNQYK